MNQPLKILLLEDNLPDVEIIERLLVKSKLNCEFSHSSTKEEFLHSLEAFSPDVILCDHSLPQFNSSDALDIVRSKLPYLPFLMVAGTVSEDYAAGIIKQGADDYILKDRLSRLPSAIGTAIKKRQALREIADYRYALDNSSNIAITDLKGIITYANENFCRICKYTSEELIGKDHRLINSGYHPKSYIEDMWATIASGKNWQGEFCNRAKDGTLYWVDTTIIPLMDDKGKPYQYLAIRVDISEKKRLEQQSLQAHERLTFYIENSPLGFIEWDNQLKMKFWSKHAEEIFGWTEKQFDMLQKNGYSLVYKGDISRSSETGEELLTGKVDRNNIQLRANTKDGRVIWCEWFNSVLRNSSGEVISILSLVQDITERKNAEQEILDRQMRLNQSQAIAHLGSWELSFETNVPKWSDEALKIYGLQPGGSLAMDEWISFTHPDDIAEVTKKIEKSQKKFSDLGMHLRIVRKNGAVRSVYSNTRYEFDKDGKATGIVGIIHDITESKNAEEELKQSEIRLKEAQEIAHISSYEIDLSKNIHTWSDEYYKIFGFNKDEVKPSLNLFLSCVHPEDVNMAKQIIGDAFQSFSDTALNFRFIRKDGLVRYGYSEFKFDFDKKNTPTRLFGILQDVTEAQKAATELKESEMRLKEAQAVAHISNWEIDLVKDITTWSDEYYRIFGVDKKDVQASTRIFLTFIHPGDVEAVTAKLNESFASFRDESFSFRFMGQDGKIRYGYSEYKFEIDKNGKAVRLYGILQDVTRSKRAEEALKSLELEVLNQKIQEQKKITRAMIRAQEKERNHLGQELHDNINQILAGTKLYLGMAGNKNAEVKKMIRYPIELIDNSIEEIRLLCRNLVTPLKNIDLQELVRNLINILDKNTRTKTNFEYSIANESLSDDLKLNIYRIIQELSNNILKYARAKNVSVSVKDDNNAIRTVVEDDGKGFVVNDKRKGIGLSSITNRVNSFNGTVDIQSSPGNGCRISVTIPY